MSAILIDGFESGGHTTSFQRRYNTLIVPAFVTGRRGFGKAFEFADPAGTTLNYIVPNPVGASCIFALAVRFLDVNTGPFIQLVDSSNEQIALWVVREASDRIHFEVRRAAATILARSETLIGDTWYFLEWKIRVDAVSGATELRIDQVPLWQESGLNTQLQAGTTWDEFIINLSLVLGGFWCLDDIYITVGGYDALDFWGDIHAESIVPVDDGALNEWIASTPGPNHEMVDEADVDDGATFVESSGGDDDLYIFSDLPRDRISGNIKGACFQFGAAAAPAQGFNFRPLIHDPLDNASHEGSLLQLISTVYGEFDSVFETVDGAMIETQQADEFQFGIRVE